MSTFQAAGVLAAWSGTSALAALALVRHGPRIPGRVQLTAGLVGVAVGLVLLAGVGDPVSAWRFVPGLVVCGCASGLLNAGLARQAVGARVRHQYDRPWRPEEGRRGRLVVIAEHDDIDAAAIGALAHVTSLGFAFLCVAALLLGVAASARALAQRLP